MFLLGYAISGSAIYVGHGTSVEAEALSRSMPPRATRSGGPPQLAAVVHPTKTSSKKKKKARQSGTSQRPTPTSSGANADATEDAGDAHFLRLSRIATLLRDAAADHPSAHGPLLDLLKSHWTPQGDAEVPFQSTSTFVYSAMQHALVNAPYGFRGLLTSLETLQTYLRQLFDESKKGRNSYRAAQCYLTDMYNDFKVTLRLASDRLGGENPVELLFNEWGDDVRSADLDFFNPLELLQSSVKRVTAAQSNRLVKLQVAASAQRAFASSTGSASPAGSGNFQARIPPPPGLGFPLPGKRHFRLLNKKGRFPTNRDACVLCGKGELPGSQGHRAEDCGATDAEVENWVERAIPAK